jgi:hypothetical protein
MSARCFVSGLVVGLSFFALGAHAQTATFEDWFIVDAKDNSGDVIAATSTDDGKELLGYRCFRQSGSCMYVLIADTRCDDKARYPILQNSRAGASNLSAVCHKTPSSDQLVLSPYKDIEGAIKEGQGLIGFAIPMASGRFKAIRFSLKGGSEAIVAAERLMNARRNASTPGTGSGTF